MSVPERWKSRVVFSLGKRRGEAMLSPVGATERGGAEMVSAAATGPGTKWRGGFGRVPVGRSKPQAMPRLG